MVKNKQTEHSFIQKTNKKSFTMSFYHFTVEGEQRAFDKKISRGRCGKSDRQNRAPSPPGIFRHPPLHFHRISF